MTNRRKADQLQDILEDFQAKTGDALIAMVTTKDGLSVASAIKDSIAHEEDALAVAASRIVDMSNDVNSQLNQGEIGRILIEGSTRTTIVSSAGRDVLFIVVVPADAKLGLMMLSISNTAQSIAKVYN
jgi:predicted regulator of Ras-like GTPase activity (Roadblock/LC7/MglB family)